ncbi:MAG: sugar ABC transporter ATP-binding protein, partial [Candidatus Latescibacterota bacterium]|nr:sugar ABC transporter ATP-binding protein [Candidatus Latescibacterota bacterium]
MAPVIELRGVHKFFPGVHALREVDFEIEAGEVHALVGENGAGKSTLIKIIAGAYSLDEGQLEVEGVPTVLFHPRQAQDLGLVVVHQELELVPSLSVAENIFFGRLPNQKGRVLWKKLHADARILLDQVGLAVDPKTQVGYLGIAAQQLVEIARALSQQAKLIVMDEPTSALSPQEIDRLLLLIDQLRSRGVSVLYVSHKLEEVLRISNRVTVLRDGAKVACQQTAELDEKSLVELMVGRELGLGFPDVNRSAKSVALQVQNLTTDSVNNISFEVHEGEIVGFSGLMGAGRTELAQALIWVDRRRGG